MWDERSGATEPLLKKEDKGEFGKKYEHDPQFKGVTEEGRKCNDILFAVLFLLTCSAFVAISAVGFSNGDPEKLIPSDEYTTDVETKAEYWFQDAVVTVKRDADVMGGALALAIVLGMVWVQLMKMFTKIFIYLTLLIGIALVIAAGVYLFVVGGKPHNEGFRYASYAVFAIAALIVIAIVFLRSRIALTSALFKESCDGVQYNPSIFVVALILVGVFSLFVVYWTASFIYLFSIPSDSKVQIPHTPTKFDQTPRRLMFFQIFAFFWVTSFISAVFQVSVAGGIATWYFSRDVSSFGKTTGSPTFRSLGRAVTKSFGSLAFGSLILAVVKFINLMLRIAKKKAQVTNPVAKFLLGCLQCIFGVVQNLVKWINRYAYIYIAMHGDSFCSSSRNCFNLISRNFFYVAIVDLLGEIVLFVGKLLGTAACTIFTMGIVQALDRQLGYLSILMVAVIAFSVFTIFAHIIGVGVDTVLVCYLEDLERNKDGALYMPTELHKMLQEKVAKSHERIQ